MATANMGLSFRGCPFQAPDQKWQARFFLLCGVSCSLSCPFFCRSFSLPAWHGPGLVHQGGCEKIAQGKGLWENVARQPRGMWQWGQANVFWDKKGTIVEIRLSELRSCHWIVRLHQTYENRTSEFCMFYRLYGLFQCVFCGSEMAGSVFWSVSQPVDPPLWSRLLSQNYWMDGHETLYTGSCPHPPGWSTMTWLFIKYHHPVKTSTLVHCNHNLNLSCRLSPNQQMLAW